MWQVSDLYPMPDLHLFGTTHIDRPRKLERELYEFTENVDFLMSEHPREEPDFSDTLRVLIRNPSILIMGWILDVIWGVPGYLLTRSFGPLDTTVTNSVARERGLDIEPVDMNLRKRASEINILITLLSWFWAGVTVVTFLFGFLLIFTGLFYVALVVIIAGVAVGFAPVVPFALGTLSERDDVMAKNIEEVLTERGSSQIGCLVVGRGHLDGIKENLEDNSIEVDEFHKSKFLRRSL